MKKSTPKRQNIAGFRLPVIIAVFVVSGVVLVSQVQASMMARRVVVVKSTGAVTIPAPKTPSPTPAPTPKPAATSTPAPVKKVVTQPRVATAAKTLPVVAPAPDSSVNHLVPVTSTPDPTPSPTDTPTPGMGSGSSPSPTPTPAAPHATYTSTNWSGYMSPAGQFTAISGSWTVPHPSGNGSSTTADAAWIGIGGVTSGDLIQTGTMDFVSRSGRVTTQAFYELLPASSTTITSMTVAPGDAMTADIHLVSGNQWQINLSDTTQGETFSTTVTYSSSESSAEWIEEDPSYASGGLIPFDHFGSINFTDGLATSAGVSQTMAASGAQSIMLVTSSNQPVAVPSALGGDGKSFSVTGS